MFRWFTNCESCNFQRFMLQLKLSKIKCSCLFLVRSKSYYQVLGLDSAASPKDIKLAYYKLSLQHHPDKNDGSPESVAKFREITEAYEVLSNTEKKVKYDNKKEFTPEYSQHSTYNRSYYRTNNYSKPFTGKTKEYDYDEHFRRHYQEEERRQAEHEYFKRRWEAEFYRRYPNFDEYYRKRHYETYNSREEFSKVYAKRKFSLLVIGSIWFFLILIQGARDINNPDKIKKPLYYKVSEKNVDVEDKD